MILIILATVSINAIFGNNGLIQSAEKGKIAQEKAEARERLELVLADAYAEKHVAKEKYNENEYLDKFIYSREPDAEVAEAEISLNGYTFELDRSVPQLGEYIGEAGNLPPTIRNIKVQSAEKGKIAQEKAEARERLELVLADAYAEKHVAKEKYNENEYLDKFIYSREPDAEVAEAEISLNGYTFELDRSVPQLGEYIGEAGNLPPTIRNIKVLEKTETSAKIVKINITKI